MIELQILNIIAGIVLIFCSIIYLCDYIKDFSLMQTLKKVSNGRINSWPEMKFEALFFWTMMICYAILNGIF